MRNKMGGDVVVTDLAASIIRHQLFDDGQRASELNIQEPKMVLDFIKAQTTVHRIEAVGGGGAARKRSCFGAKNKRRTAAYQKFRTN